MSKKIISMLLVVSLCLSLSAVAFAADVQEENLASSNAIEDYLLYDDSYWKTIDITLDDGSVIQVEVPRNPEIQIENIFGGGASTMDFTPTVPVGTKHSYPVKISNEQLAATWAVGSLISGSIKSKIAQIAAVAVNAQAAAAIVTAAKIAFIIANVNAAWGNKGFLVTSNFEYTSRYINKDDHYIYEWSLKGVNIRTY